MQSTSCNTRRWLRICQIAIACSVAASVGPVRAQAPSNGTEQRHTADAVLSDYQRALGGAAAIAGVGSMTVHGEIEGSGISGRSTFVYQAKPFRTRMEVTRADESKVVSGFDGTVSWSVDPTGPRVDTDTPLEAARRDADLQYALHQPAYFKNLDFAGVTDFDGRPCYWLHGTTHWGKDNNQFYDVQTALLAGYRFQADDSAAATVIVLFQDYRNFGGPLIATRVTSRSGERWRTLTYKSVTYELLADSLFEVPPSVSALRK